MSNVAKLILCLALMSFASVAVAQQHRSQNQQPQTSRSLPQQTQDFIGVDAPVVALEHVKLIDGTGAAPKDDQTIVIDGSTIKAIGPAASTSVPEGAKVLDLSGHSVMPGMVGMHEHLFYNGPTGRGRIPGVPEMYPTMAYSFPRLYLAAGVTSLRTTGSMEPYTDLEVKRYIDAGRLPGPKMHLTGPYLQGPGSYLLQLHALSSPEEATKFVNFWADEGFTSFKAYQQITRAELGAAIKAAHARGIKVTGHLCSVTFHEAVDLGIDDLEHGLGTDTEFVADKKPDECPPYAESREVFDKLDVNGSQVQDSIHYLVSHHVAVTSTLPVAEAGVPNRPPLTQRFLDVLSPLSKTDYLIARANTYRNGNVAAEHLKKEMQFEYAFVKAGGTLLAGLDPTGNGGVVAGFGDQREVELLVEAGFTPVEAIHIASENGAKFLGVDSEVGTLQVGKKADLVVMHGDPASDINDIEKVVWVFKDGKGYDSQKLIDSVQGLVGLR
jgi:imidazolonepropionase-like amidohydrolase